MKTLKTIIIIILISSCQENNNKNLQLNKKGLISNDIDTLKKNETKEVLEIVPVFGYRFSIKGDFNGDGKEEILNEHFFSLITNKETNKFYKNANYDELVELTIKKKPFSFLSSNDNMIDTLLISENEQLLGLSFLKNEGDLNEDGTDEISYVINHADWSNMNTWHIITYQNNEWSELYSFSIRDWQIPDIPETSNEYGLFGLVGKIVDKKNDSLTAKKEQLFFEFEGLVKKTDKNKIQIIYMNDESIEETLIIDLSKKGTVTNKN